MFVPFKPGDRVRIRPEYFRPEEGDFTDIAIVEAVDERDGTVDVSVDGQDWGQWFCRLPDGTYEIALEG
jgi:hypothetical protein